MKRFSFPAFCIAALAASFLVRTTSADIVVNGGFESGSFAPGWSFTDASGFTFIDNDSTFAHTGNDYALLGASPLPGTLLQTLATTPGATYQLTFWLASDRSSTVDNSLQVLWNGVSVFSQVNIPAPGFTNPYVLFTISNLTAAGATATLEFDYVNNDDFFRLDDVSVNAVPEVSTTSFAILGFGMLGFVYGARRVTRRSRRRFQRVCFVR
jgi:hypothetical protein